MCRLHPSIVRRLDALCAAVLSVSAPGREAIREFVEAEEAEAERSAWSSARRSARILGERVEQTASAASERVRDVPMAAAFTGTGILFWVMWTGMAATRHVT